MVRIFLTGDNHLGLRYSGHEKGGQIAQCRLDALEEMAAIANREECNLFVVAGDLFEGLSVSKEVVGRAVKALAGFGGEIAILPGNHDFCNMENALSKNLWENVMDAAKGSHQITLLTENKPYSYELPVGEDGEDCPVVLYPAPCSARHSAKNNLGWIAELDLDGEEEAAGYRIGIAHGSVRGETIDSEEEYFPMTREELEEIPMDVWLVGHTHVPFPKAESLSEKEFRKTDERVFNAGTHVQTDVNCNTEGLCFIIEIDEEKNVSVKKVVTGNVRFYRPEVKVSPGKLESELRDALKGFAKSSVVEVSLKGVVSEEEYMNRSEIINTALERFLEGRLRSDETCREITEARIDSEFPETSFSARLLKSLISKPSEARRLYNLLNELKGQRK